MANPGLAAVQIGDSVGATSREVNRALAELGLLAGDPGMYSITQKGAEFAVEVGKQSSNLPQAAHWPTRYWDEKIVDVLEREFTPERWHQLRNTMTAERLAKVAARKAAEAAEEALRLSEQEEQTRQAALAVARAAATRKGILIVGGVVVAAGLTYGAYRLAPVVKRAWDEKAAPQLVVLRARLSGGGTDREVDDTDADG